MTPATFVLTVARGAGSRGAETAAEGSVVALEKDRLRLDSSAPVPPGSRVEGTVAGRIAIRGKVIGAARGADGRYVVTIKLADVTREERALLAKLT